MKYCRECGKEINEKAVICVHCGCKVNKGYDMRNNKWIALLLWLFLGGIGAHHFYIGKTGLGIAYLLSMTIGWILIIPPIVVGVMLIIDFIAILTGEIHGVKLES